MNQEVKFITHDLETEIACPYCWQRFQPEETKWISEHPEIQPDPLLGSVNEKLRFLPTRFNVAGEALDERNIACKELACPACHLLIPRPCIEMKPFKVSIVGTPSSGKSYFLAALTWQLRKVLPTKLALSFSDADPKLNKVINSYEQLQFFNPDKDKYVKIEKTEEEGDLYNVVKYSDENVITYPAPFFFTIRPTPSHPAASKGRIASRLLTIYDNAGESFDPDKDVHTNQVTRHLAEAQVIFFIYDPTQDPRFRDACIGVSEDPQVANPNAVRDDRQDIIFNNMTALIRRHAHLSQTAKHDAPIIVIVTKSDIWLPLLSEKELPEPYVDNAEQGFQFVHTEFIEKISAKLRELLLQYSPGIVSEAETFSDNVIYLPVSATGTSPKFDEERSELGIRPQDMDPTWAEVPLVYSLAKWCDGLVGSFARQE